MISPFLISLSGPGIHYIGDLVENKPFRCILDQITNGQLQWEPLENPFDQVILGPPENRRCYPIYSGKNRLAPELKKCFPGEEKAIDEFVRLTKVSSCHLFLLLCSSPKFMVLNKAVSVNPLLGPPSSSILDSHEKNNSHGKKKDVNATSVLYTVEHT